MGSRVADTSSRAHARFTLRQARERSISLGSTENSKIEIELTDSRSRYAGVPQLPSRFHQ